MEKTVIIIISSLVAVLALWMAHRTEIDFGRVLNDRGDGKLYNGEAYYNYIAYPGRFKQDDIVMTVCILNPLNNYCDDIVVRFDKCVLKNTQEGAGI